MTGSLMVLAFGSSSDGYGQSLVFVLLLLPVLAGTTYLLLYYLVPRYLLKRRFWLFGLFSCYTIIAAAWLEIMIVMGLLMVVYHYNFQMLNPKIHDLGYLAVSMALVILPALTFQITRQWYKERETNDRLHQEKLELKLDARQKELDYLKEQIRPHFLFNVLNNLYGLTLEKSDDAPQLVLKVSEMLDYMLYRSSQPTVPLVEELHHINNYIEIQKIRCGDRLDLSFVIDSSHRFYCVAPMILLPFVENCFKHGISATNLSCFITIEASINKKRLNFTIVNSLPRDRSLKTKPGAGGVGLDNVLKRLNLLYRKDFNLRTEQTEQTYQVDLSIPLERISHEMEVHDC